MKTGYRGKVGFMLGALLAALIAGACASTRDEATRADEPERRYARAAPPEQNIPAFGELLESVRQLNCITYYRQADFWDEPGLPMTEDSGDFWKEADSVSTFTETLSGTATIVQYSKSRIAAVTALHVIDFPDTVRSYHYAHGRRSGIKAIAVKRRQDIFLPAIDQVRNLEVLADDTTHDIALVGQTLELERDDDFSFNIPVGRASDLDWGSLGYVLAYPAGMAMVTSGMVSQPDRNREHSFLLDVVFNKGMSGAPVVARRMGSPGFEWVGIVTSSSAGSEYLLVPDEREAGESIDRGEPFKGEVFAWQFRRLRYGVTMAVSIETVWRMIEKQRGWLFLKGYRFEFGEEAGGSENQ